MQDMKEEIVGQIVGGTFGELIIRKKRDEKIELGEILVAEDGNEKHFLQIYDIRHGSQISQQNIELISGLQLEESNDVDILDENIRNYSLAIAKSILFLGNRIGLPKSLPPFMKKVRRLNKEDLRFLSKPENALFFGYLRSGNNKIDVPVFLNGEDILSHHVLLAATTGRGKSNLTSVILWDLAGKDYAGALVLDPHDEYFKSSRKKPGLERHPMKHKIAYYSRAPIGGGNSLYINLKSLKPEHFDGVLNLSDPQREAIYYFFSRYNENWLYELLNGENYAEGFQEGSISVLKRKLSGLLEVRKNEQGFKCSSIFKIDEGETIVDDICSKLEKGNVVIVDTSLLSSSQEILVGSIIASRMLERYSRYKRRGELGNKPVITIVLEEAPRVIGKEALEAGPNVFSRIAREGRKFKVGLYAITQMPSLIPLSILANMNTKIIMGIEIRSERQSLIESCPQDLSDESKSIASLDKGEAIVSSTFSRFALPIAVPLLSEFVSSFKENNDDEDKAKRAIIGM